MSGRLDMRKSQQHKPHPDTRPPRFVDDCMSTAFNWALGYYIRGTTTKNNRLFLV